MLELGPGGSAGAQPGVRPLLLDGTLVGALSLNPVRAVATAFVDDREWVYARERPAFVARWAEDPVGVARFRAHRTSFWRGAYALDLEGTPVDCREVSWWRSDRRYRIGEAVVAQSAVVDKRLVLHGGQGLTLPQVMFLFWLEVVARRQSSAAAF